jgi:hypothetical protein
VVGANNLKLSHGTLNMAVSSQLGLGGDLVISDDATIWGSASALVAVIPYPSYHHLSMPYHIGLWWLTLHTYMHQP